MTTIVLLHLLICVCWKVRCMFQDCSQIPHFWTEALTSPTARSTSNRGHSAESSSSGRALRESCSPPWGQPTSHIWSISGHEVPRILASVLGNSGVSPAPRGMSWALVTIQLFSLPSLLPCSLEVLIWELPQETPYKQNYMKVCFLVHSACNRKSTFWGGKGKPEWYKGLWEGRGWWGSRE